MGCCQSVPEAPDELIPDPLPGQDWHFVVKSLSRFNQDYAVYQDKEDDDRKWLFLNQEGGGKFGGGEARIDLENFVRGGDPENPKKGEVLWRCRYDSRPSYKTEYDSDSSDDEGMGELLDFLGANTRHTTGVKYKMETRAIFEPIKNGGVPYFLKCKAKGYARRTVRIRNDVDTGERNKDYDEEKTVKKISYKIKDQMDNTLDEFKIELDHMESRNDIYWESNAFHVQKTGGFFRSGNTDIHTKGGGDPGLALLMGHFVSTDLTPSNIANNYNLNWYDVDGYESDFYSEY